MERRTITTGEMIAQQQSARRLLAPGIWEDAKGDLHFSVPDILAWCGLPDTEANRDHLVAQIQALYASSEVVEIIEQHLRPE